MDPNCGRAIPIFAAARERYFPSRANSANSIVGSPACGESNFEFLRGFGRQVATTLCGRNSVQIARRGRGEIDFAALAERLRSAGEVTFNDFLLRFKIDDYDITVFRDARSIIRGMTDPAVARGLYAKYIGS